MSNKSVSVPEQHKIFHYSYVRCINNRRFFPVFCQLFRAKCRPDCSLYKADPVRQARMLEISTISILQAGYSQEQAMQVRELAQVFANLDMALRAEDIQIWLDCLLEAVMLCDPDCNELQQAHWRHNFLDGIRWLERHMQRPAQKAARKESGSVTQQVAAIPSK